MIDKATLTPEVEAALRLRPAPRPNKYDTDPVEPTAPTFPPMEDAAPKSDDWPPLDPLPESDGTSAPPPYPLRAMGAMLGNAAGAIARDVQAPDAMAAGAVLAAASLSVQSLADIKLPHGQVCPLSLFFVTSGSSGDRKSAVDAVACGEIENRRRALARQHHQAMEAYEREMVQAKKNDAEPQEPVLRALTIGNATIEGVSRLLKTQSAVGIFSPDGGDVLGGHSMKDVNRVATMAFFLKAWSGESLDSMRGGAGYTSLLGRRVAMHVMVQPVLLAQLLSDPLASGQGFLARCLIAQPNTLAGTRMYREVDPSEDPDVQRYSQRMVELLDMRPTVWEDSDGYELKPRQLTLDPEARAMWIRFHDAIELEQSEDGQLTLARAFASKAAEHAARVAGVISMFEDPAAIQVGADAMAGAIELVTFYTNEHLRLTGTGKQEQRDKRLHVLLNWLHEQGPLVDTKRITRSGPRAVRELKTSGVNALLSELTQRGYIRQAGSSWEVRRGV